MPHKHSVYNTDEHFVIDAMTRAITQQSGKSKLIQGDHNSERYEFEMPRMIEGHDMSLCNSVKVNYLNIASNRIDQSKGPYEVTDLQVSPDDENIVILSWLISRNATKYAGQLHFNIKFECLTDSVVNYTWQTDICKEIKVSSTIMNDDDFVEDEEYIDILNQWKQEILEEVDGSVKTVNGIEPDENGNVIVEIPEVDFTGLVKSVNGETPDVDGNVTLDISVDDSEVIDMMIELNAFPAVMDADGAFLADLDGSILLM